jgi:gamma-glutamyltranspeptidase/glutathione hydrolase
MSKTAAIVASSEACIDAGAEILRAGGNVVDAAVAAVFGTSAGEPSITSLAGGGVLLYRDGASGVTEVCDFFANAPGLESSIDTPHHERDDDFGGIDILFPEASITQTFYIGRASAAVPGVLRGMLAALQRWGSLPLDVILAPTVHHLRHGVVMTAYQEKCFSYLEQILRRSELGRRTVFDENGCLFGDGAIFRNTELADTLEALGACRVEELDAFLRDAIENPMLDAFGEEAGGRITRRDVERWQPIFREPLRVESCGARIDTNPAPSFGGPSVAHTLALFDHVDLGETHPGTSERFQRLAAVYRSVSELRASDSAIFDRDDAAERFRSRVDEILVGDAQPRGGTEPRSPGNTTHVSIADSDGNAATVTLSHGEGNGFEIPGTGIFMNNFLGETDLFPEGLGHYAPGARLSTMMAPSIVVDASGNVSALGSGGSNRIRTAISHVISALVLDGLSPEDAVDSGRIHVENGVLSAESYRISGGDETLSAARRLAQRYVAFASDSLFFGGVNVAHRRADGRVIGVGDGRRNGIVRIVG